MLAIVSRASPRRRTRLIRNPMAFHLLSWCRGLCGRVSDGGDSLSLPGSSPDRGSARWRQGVHRSLAGDRATIAQTFASTAGAGSNGCDWSARPESSRLRNQPRGRSTSHGTASGAVTLMTVRGPRPARAHGFRGLPADDLLVVPGAEPGSGETYWQKPKEGGLIIRRSGRWSIVTMGMCTA